MRVRAVIPGRMAERIAPSMHMIASAGVRSTSSSVSSTSAASAVVRAKRSLKAASFTGRVCVSIARSTEGVSGEPPVPAFIFGGGIWSRPG